MGYPRLAQLLYNSPLMITPEKAEVIEAVFRAYAEGRMPEQNEQRAALLAPAPAVARQRPYSVTEAGIAVVPVMGTLLQRSSRMDAESGLSGYNKIGADFAEAMADSNVRGVLLEIDSPGGQVAGVFELAAQIRAAAKPVYAVANEQAASAAYLLGSAAQKFFVPEPGVVGSIGVRMMHVDQSQMDAKRGLVYTPIFAGARKNDLGAHAPLTSDALAVAQRTVDHVYAMLTDTVAAHRNIHPDAVRATEAGVFHAGHAVKLSLADGVAGFDATVQMLTDAVHAAPLSTYGLRAESAQFEWETMTLTNEQETEMAEQQGTIGAIVGKGEGRTPDPAKQLIDILDAKQEADKLAALAHEDGKKKATARAKVILTCEAAKDRPSLAQHLAFDTDLSAEQAQELLAKAAPKVKASANPLAAAMAGVPNPKVGADSGEQDELQATVTSILNAGKKPRAA